MNHSSYSLVGKTYFLSMTFPCLALLFLQLHAPRNGAGDLDLVYCDFININPARMCVLSKPRETRAMKTNALTEHHTVMQEQSNPRKRARATECFCGGVYLALHRFPVAEKPARGARRSELPPSESVAPAPRGLARNLQQQLILSRRKAVGSGPSHRSLSSSSVIWKEAGASRAEETGVTGGICHKS